MSIAVILIPAGAILANVAIGIWAMWTLSRTHPGDLLVLADVTIRIRYFFILTFCVNMLCASLICFKIWRVHVLAKRVVDVSATKNVLEIVIESAALYCAYLFALIVTSSVGSNVFFVFLDPLPPVTAVIFSMLIVRAQITPKEPSTAQRSSIHFWSRSYGPGLSTVARRSDGSLADAEINVNLQHITDSVTDSTVVDSTSRIGYHPGERGSSSREYELSKMA
ncbi:hypothetical protein TRAPUB_6247 [Trametes pubescens]|uniref:Uncharacterized protein n=1 Tax=Trametes pubescens TaxID=154538 RepID=A0A1M2V6G5_TRAPU|nr:hypothetical protein TRAPUB_6247 [Trametes pubescens]